MTIAVQDDIFQQQASLTSLATAQGMPRFSSIKPSGFTTTPTTTTTSQTVTGANHQFAPVERLLCFGIRYAVGLGTVHRGLDRKRRMPRIANPTTTANPVKRASGPRIINGMMRSSGTPILVALMKLIASTVKRI